MSDLDLSVNKTPPNNLEAEQAVLGAILLDKEAINKALEIIRPHDFYHSAHRAIFEAMLELDDKSEPIDIVTVTNSMRASGTIDKAGGASYISSIIDQINTSANVKYHSKIIKEKSLMRSLIESSNDIISKIYEGSIDPEELVDYAESRIFDISEKRITVSFEKMDALLGDTFKTIEELYSKKYAITGVPSGFNDLDKITTGFQNGDLVIIGGRPGMGKTAFCLNIAQNAALQEKLPVAIFSLEMSKKQLALRMLCSEARVDSNKVRTGFINKEDWPLLTRAAGDLSNAELYIDDSSYLSVLEMRAKARRLKKEHGLSLIIIDYIQLMKGREGLERREQEISDISRSLKGLAKELDVPVIALSQLNRLVEQRRPPVPTLADLRESGAIEQDADVILFLYRDEYYYKDKSDKKGTATVHIAKQRNGPAGVSVDLAFIAKYTRFEDFSDRHLHEEYEEEVY
ncbi:MAG: replicative DNA helicase [Nitrospirota bacterium]|nr:MAG: replicative DNA helicase [Nitrospirota bacterium]